MADRYYTGLRLGHNERVYSVIDEDTGEVRFLGGGGGRVLRYPVGYSFGKLFDLGIEVLLGRFRGSDWALFLHFVGLLRGRGNVIGFYGDGVSMREISDSMGGVVSFKSVGVSVGRLKELGVIKMSDKLGYWVMNPYIACKSKYIRDDVRKMFSDCSLTRDILRLYESRNRVSFVWRYLE